MYKILIVEDDSCIAEAIRKEGEAWNFEMHIAGDLRHVTDCFAAIRPHLVLMDIGLPFYNGFYWCTEIRKISSVPILFLSSASDNLNLVMAVNLGADDFLAKPFDLGVLMAKVRALLRRAYDFSAEPPLPEHRGAVLDAARGQLRLGDAVIPLTKNETGILLCLMESRGRTVSREKLMERLWETDRFVDENTLSVNVNRLRRKLDAAGLPGFIETRVGEGYRLAE